MGMLQNLQGAVRSLVGINTPQRPGTTSQYMRGGKNMTFANWAPGLRSARSDVGVAWDQATARAVDLIHNNGWISGMMDQAVANTVGTGLRLRSLPDHDVLGITADEGAALGRNIEQRFRVWADNPDECDIEGRRTFGQQQASAFRSWFPTGEIWAELPWRPRPGLEFGTKVRLLPPTRISRTSSPMDRLVQGVYLDRDDRAIGYQTFKTMLCFF